MRPVARIAQSVEQGIENPRVLGSIPSPGTTYFEPSPLAGVFAFQARQNHYFCIPLTTPRPLRQQRMQFSRLQRLAEHQVPLLLRLQQNR